MIASASSVGAITDIRARLFSNGYRFVPVLTKDKNPLQRDWPGIARNQTLESAQFFDPWRSNTGILCDELRGIDLDIDWPFVLSQVQSLAVSIFGTTLLRWRNDSPRVLLLYKAVQGSPSKKELKGKLGKVEALGKGQQFVAFGVHPDGAEYQWRGNSPLELRKDDLIAVTEEQVDRFLSECAVLIQAGPNQENTTPDQETATRSEVPQSKILKGQRTPHLVSLAGTMNRRGFSPCAILAALLAENEARCDPRLPDEKVRGIASDIPKRYPSALGSFVSFDGTDTRHRTKSSVDWSIPEALGSELPAVPKFDAELLPASLRPLVADVSERMQVPIDFPAVVAVATLAGVTNRRAAIQPKANDTSWSVIPNLWGGIVAPPGLMKSPVLAALMAPVRAVEASWRARYADESKEYENEKIRQKLDQQVWEAEYKKQVKKTGGGPEKPRSELVEPTQMRLITSDATFESLHKLMTENPAGLFVVRDELTGWLAGLERQGREGERAFFLECWNGDGAATLDRIGRGTIHVEHCCVSLFGGIQPARLRSYLADALKDGPSNDGLIQRFQLLVWPDSKDGWQYIDRRPSSSALEQMEIIVRRLSSMDVRAPLRLKFSNAAQGLFIEWLTDLESRIRSQEDMTLQAHLAKYRSLMPSLALLFSLADNRTDLVELNYAQLAADWCDYLEPHAVRIYASHVSAELRAALVLSRKLTSGWQKTEKRFSLRDVYRSNWTGLTNPDEAREAVSVLEAHGWVRGLSSEHGNGRPSEVYEINPLLEVANADK